MPPLFNTTLAIAFSSGLHPFSIRSITSIASCCVRVELNFHLDVLVINYACFSAQPNVLTVALVHLYFLGFVGLCA